MAGLWRGYRRLLVEYPLRTQMASSGLLALVGDGVAQLGIERRPLRQWDAGRSGRFVAVSVFWVTPIVGPWLGFLGRRVGTGLHPKLAPVLRVAVDQSLMAPFMLSSILVWLRFLEERKLQKSLRRCRQDFLEIYLNGLKVWVPAMLLNFYLVPPVFRLVFTQERESVALVWNTYVSWRANLQNGDA